MRIAVIGSGISGLACAWKLSRAHQVSLFEANHYLGGHTHTHDIEIDGESHAVDTGFMVFNPHHYPLLSTLFSELGIASQPTAMSFSVRNESSGLEYNAQNLNTMFCQRRNLLSPRMWRMLRDILRFYREAPALLEQGEDASLDQRTIGDYLIEHEYSDAFRDEHLIPMASALWSAPSARILSFPLVYLVRFMANHQMLQVRDRPQWRVVRGGSNHYIKAMRTRWQVDERIGLPVRTVLRGQEAVQVITEAGSERFDQVILACHSDQALALLDDANDRERDILGAIPYQTNDTVLHTDAGLLPRSRKAWAAWNAYISGDPAKPCTVSYCMNLLQGIQSRHALVVSLNRCDDIDPAKVLRRIRYEHPQYSLASVAARQRKAEIQGRRRTWFAGAYWGWGFHEDGMRSAVEVAEALGAATSTPVATAATGAADQPAAECVA